jgi:hypothetical protein
VAEVAEVAEVVAVAGDAVVSFHVLMHPLHHHHALDHAASLIFFFFGATQHSALSKTQPQGHRFFHLLLRLLPSSFHTAVHRKSLEGNESRPQHTPLQRQTRIIDQQL